MMRLVSLMFLFAIYLLAHGGVYAQTRVGSWNVSLHKDDCRIWDQWVNDDGGTSVLGIKYIDQGKSLIIAFRDSTWRLKKNQDFPVVLSVDENWQENLPGSAVDVDAIAAYLLPVNTAALSALMMGRELFLDVPDLGEKFSYTYTLEDTRGALSALDACRFETLATDEQNNANAGSGKHTTSLVLSRSILSLSKDSTVPQSVFPASTPKIYYQADYIGAKANDVARVDWIAEQTQAVAPNYRIDSASFDLKGQSGKISSNMNMPNNGWPIGVYRVDVFINDVLTEKMTFRIN